MHPARLKHALMGFFEIWATCDSCGREKKLDDLALSIAKGQDTLVDRLKVRCECGKRGRVTLRFPAKKKPPG